MNERSLTQRSGWVWCAGAALLFGAATPTTKLLTDRVGSVALAGLLYFGAAIAVAPFALAERRPTATTINQRIRLSTAVVVGGGMAPVLLVLALDRTPASTVSLFLNLELVATATIARLFLREHIGRRAGMGITIVTLGGVILAGTAGGGITVGVLLVVAACVCWGVDNAVTASLDGFSPAQITLAKGFVAGTVNLAIGTIIAGFPRIGVIVAALAIGALGYGLSITMWITGARLIGATRGQVVFALAPFIGAGLAWPINGERPGLTMAVAFVVSLSGVAIVGSARHRHVHRHEPLEHSHPIDVTDEHHGPGAIVVLSGQRHRHLALEHEHEHLPDLDHRHSH